MKHEMVDLHIHSNHSMDTLHTVSDVLRACEREGMSTISITDHDSVGAYAELQDQSIRKLFSGNIITGVEISCQMDGMICEILGYNFDPTKIEIVTANFLSETQWRQRIVAKFKQAGLSADYTNEDLEAFNLTADLLEDLRELNREALEKMNPNFATSIRAIFRSGICNSKSPLFVPLEEGIDIACAVKQIHDAGGIAFLAHPFVYENAHDMLDYAINHVDGIEVFHPSATTQQREYLLDICKKHGKLISGGSDWHGYNDRPLNSQKIMKGETFL